MSGAGYARKEQTQHELRQLDNDLQAWLTHRRDQDAQLQQYRTQLQVVADLIGNTIQGLEHALLAVPVDGEEVYAQCRLFDLRTLWVRRVWQFFKEKFDQRDDPVVGAVLRAADEVVWSCYRQVWARLTTVRPGQQRPAPLPFIEPRYSPQAFPSSLLSRQFNDSSLGGSFLRDRLNGLTLSVVRLSPACVRSPWWLVYLGHEMGHHLQHDAGLVAAFRAQVETIVREQKPGEQEIENWGVWSEEIFADLASLHLMGQWALRAMIELERAEPESMATPRISYPAPYVRLHLMAVAADRLGLPGTAMLRAAALPFEPARLARDLELAGHLARVVDGPLPGLSVSLRELVAFRQDEFLLTGEVMSRAAQFVYPHEPPVTHTLRAARLYSCAALAAWAQTLTTANVEEGARQRQHLASVAPHIIAESREAGTRGGEATSDAQLSLTDLLLQAGREQLAFEGGSV